MPTIKVPDIKLVESLISPRTRNVGLTNWAAIVHELQDNLVGDLPSLYAAAATIKVETASQFCPIEEMGSPQYFEKVYGHRRDYKTDDSGRWLWRGRGFIQLTGELNYIFAGNDLKVPLQRHPELACETDIAVRIFRWFWAKEEVYRMANRAYTSKKYSDWVRVRWAVNGGNNGLNEFISCLNVFGLKIANPTVTVSPPAIQQPQKSVSINTISTVVEPKQPLTINSMLNVGTQGKLANQG